MLVRPTRSTVTAVSALLFLLLMCTAIKGCGSSPPSENSVWCVSATPCARASYAASLPASNVVYVNSCCVHNGPADGTLDHPYDDIGSALADASDGTTVAVAAGRYDEELVLTSRVSILGAGRELSLIASGEDEPTLQIIGLEANAKASVTISGFTLRGTGGIGILVSGSHQVELSQLGLTGYGMGLQWNGVGVYVVDSEDVVIASSSLQRNRASGVVFSGSTGRIAATSLVSNGLSCNSASIAAVDGSHLKVGADLTMYEPGGTPGMGSSYTGGAILNSPGVAIYSHESVIEVRSILMAANVCGGVLIVKATTAGQGSIVAGNLIAASNRFGISAHNSQATILGNSISSIGLLPEEDENYSGGDCILVSNELDESLSSVVGANDVAGCDGTGVLLSGLLAANITGNHVFAAQQGGIWLQDHVEALDFAENVVDSAWGAGIVVGGQSRAKLRENRITSSIVAQFMEIGKAAGSGVTLFPMAHGILLADLGNDAVSLSGNTVALCAMAGLVVGACDSNSIAFDEASGNAKANVVAGNAMAGLVVQGSAEAVADLAAIQDESVGDKVNFTSAVFGPNLGPNVLEPQIEWPVATVRGVLGPGDLSLCIPPACTD